MAPAVLTSWSLDQDLGLPLTTPDLLVCLGSAGLCLRHNNREIEIEGKEKRQMCVMGLF